MLDMMKYKSDPSEINVQARVYAIGATKPALTIQSRPMGKRRKWPQVREIIAEHFDCSPDDVTAPDCYWGGECGDANSVDAVVIRGRIVATFDKPISADDVAAIYANTVVNSHVTFTALALSE